MQNVIEIKHLTREEKLRMMDALWADLLSEEELLESSAWHKAALQATEKRLEAGKEKILDWHYVGIPQDRIAKRLGLDQKTIHNH